MHKCLLSSTQLSGEGGRCENLCAQVRASLPSLPSWTFVFRGRNTFVYESTQNQPQDLPPVTQGLQKNITADGPVFGSLLHIYKLPTIKPRDNPPALGRVRSEVITAPTPSLSKIWTCGAASELPTQKDQSVIICSPTWMIHQWIRINKVLNEDGLIWTMSNCNSVADKFNYLLWRTAGFFLLFNLLKHENNERIQNNMKQ